MLAFAHKLQEAIDNGEYTDRADAARKLGLTRARVSQLLDLLMLAPDIQGKILFMERVDGIEPTSERHCEVWLVLQTGKNKGRGGAVCSLF